MSLHLLDIYRSPNIGIFMRGNDKNLLVPKGLAPSKCEKLEEDLQVVVVQASIAGSRLLGPLAVMNNNGILVSHLAEPEEMREIAQGTGLRIDRLDSKFTALGNLIATNDKRAIVSPILDSKSTVQVRDVLGAEVEMMAIQEYYQVGSLIVATNAGAAVYPKLDEEESSKIGAFLGVEAYPTSVNGGIPYVSSGLVANSRNAIAGNQTTGPELVFITRALKV
ncbi:MAG: translation initiation factor IF-6 [Thaumarchaeota archaeon]|nr:translation initiation factor IF-6 [Nitrososphaerota archaeon]